MMRVSELGEFGLIALLCREFGIDYPPAAGAASRPGVLVDIGDDALVTSPLPVPQIWTTDTLVEGVHFMPARTAWRDTGWKALAVNVSDIAAMGGSPGFALVSLCLPGDFCVEDALEFYRGLRDCCESFGVKLGGGDIVRAPAFVATIALSGATSLGADGSPLILTRSAARPGDAVAVTGTLGDSAAGLRLLESHAARVEATAALFAAHERPVPRVAAGRRAVAAGIRCGMDISDGLVQDAGHVARASTVSLEIEARSIPLSPQLRSAFPDEAVDLALTGGEDYQLLLCGPRDTIERLIVEGLDLTIIGRVSGDAAGVRVTDAAGVERAYPAGGWDHFRGAGP